jgi:thiamine-monophosphate kinase
MKCLIELGEDEVVRRLVAVINQYAVAGKIKVKIGDDCAWVKEGLGGAEMILKTDTVMEGVHFLAGEQARWVGRKALARCISDFAAAGARPEVVMVGLMVNPEMKMEALEEVYHGMCELAQKYGIQVVGGETTKSSQLALTVTLVGSIEAGQRVGRSGARAGDLIVVTGKLGGSYESKRHLTFEPRLLEGQWLWQQSGITAMMDISDGLERDLGRMMQASVLQAELELEALPLNDGCDRQAGLHDGEDYELLMTVQSESWEELKRQWDSCFPKLELTKIGCCRVKINDEIAVNSGWDGLKS